MGGGKTLCSKHDEEDYQEERSEQNKQESSEQNKQESQEKQVKKT